MSYDALHRWRHSLHHQVYCITTVPRDKTTAGRMNSTLRMMRNHSKQFECHLTVRDAGRKTGEYRVYELPGKEPD